MTRATALSAAIAATIAAPLLAWALIGNLSEPGLTDPDFLLPPLTTTPAIRFALLAVSAVVLAVGLATTWTSARRRVITQREATALVPALGIGAFTGLAVRVLTAGGVGANIGGGLVVMAAPFVVLMLGAVLVMLLVR